MARFITYCQFSTDVLFIFYLTAPYSNGNFCNELHEHFGFCNFGRQFIYLF